MASKFKTYLSGKFLLIFALIAAAGCTQTGNVDGEGLPVGPFIRVTPGLPIVFSAEAAETYEIAVLTDQESWSARSDRGWCIVGDITETGFRITAQPNNNAAPPQTATVTVEGGEAAPATIIVTQLGRVDPLRAYDHQIATEQDLIDFRKAVFAAGGDRHDGLVSLTAVLTADITLTQPWIPIGLDEEGGGRVRFNGIFNGNGKTISGLTIAGGNYPEAGLFACVEDAVVTDVALDGVNITNTGDGDARTGALVGSAVTSEDGRCIISLCSAAGSVRGGSSTGGLVGYSTGAQITRSRAETDVTAVSAAGGLVGTNISGTIAACYATGAVSAASVSEGEVAAGGLVGHNSGKILFSYSAGNVSASGTAPASERAGGLVGYNYNETPANTLIGSCYSRANASAGDGANNVGSFVGLFQAGTIAQCHSAGTPAKAIGSGMTAEVNTAEGECGKTVGAPGQEGAEYTAEGIITTVTDANNRYLFSVTSAVTLSSEGVWTGNAIPQIDFKYTGR